MNEADIIEKKLSALLSQTFDPNAFKKLLDGFSKMQFEKTKEIIALESETQQRTTKVFDDAKNIAKSLEQAKTNFAEASKPLGKLISPEAAQQFHLTPGAGA